MDESSFNANLNSNVMTIGTMCLVEHDGTQPQSLLQKNIKKKEEENSLL